MDESANEPAENGADASTASVSFTESPKKCNLSFSINFDFNDVNSENSTDSENADLQIDISEVDTYEPSSKHRREAVEEASMLNEMEEEIERQLDAKAAKTNLTASNVKNILKHVIPYEHLMTMVQKWLQDTENDVNIGPKLTRAKAKKLAAAKVNIPWPITTAQQTSSEVQALIQEELPEDSSDEEYNPEHDKQSDDDREVENTASSDIESRFSASINNKDAASSSEQVLSHIQYDSEGIFKIPAIPHVATDEESIGQRTRSKLSLSETSLEEIEQAFVPPDITADMTEDWDCELDEDWDNFLKEFTQPLTQELAVDDDPEADPEYNILEDETDLLDKEELRTDRAVEVPRKEQYDLIAELLELTLMFSTQEQEVESSRKKKVLDNTAPPNESDAVNCSMARLLPVLAESELPQVMNSEQRLLLATQFQQHVQLMAQHFVMTYMHPDYHSLAKECKQNLNSLRYLSNGPNSAFNAKNLETALKLVSIWENKFDDAKFCANFKKSIMSESAQTQIYCANKWRYLEQFPPELEKLFVESKALMYPHLLPWTPFRSGAKYAKPTYSKSEEIIFSLIALGIEQFLPFVICKSKKFHTKKMRLFDVTQLISHHLLPCRDAKGLLNHIIRRRASKDENPIRHYFKKGYAPRIIHYIMPESELRAPKDQPIELLPQRWQMYLQKEHKSNLADSKCLFDFYNNLSCEKDGINAIIKSYCSIPNNHILRNPVVNMLPKILPANPKISKIDNSTKQSSKFDNSGDKKVLDNTIQDTEVHKRKTPIHNKTRASSCALKANTSDVKPIQTDQFASDKTNTKLSTVLTRSSKISQESPQISSELPQIRKTTPRLAKTRSAQNMKLMAQALGSKNSSNCSTLKSKEKDTADKNIDKRSSTSSKVDNEEEIAELMLASSTIIKDPVSRKKAKQTRELEIIKRLLKSENPLTEEEREAKFAASYLQKLHLILESNNPETFKAVIKLYLDYSEKLENINHTTVDPSIIDGSQEFSNKQRSQDSAIKKDILTVQLYQEVCKKLQDYPEICADFLLFLKPHQAAMIGKSMEYMMLQKMNDFVHVAQIYFAKQPSRIAKMMQAITQLSSDPHTTLKNVYSVMSSVFKGHPLVMDMFLQILPTAKPPESLLGSHMFENMTCPLGPYDKNTIYTENASELYENIEVPTATCQEDPYGGENCKCDCHSTDEANLKNNSEHCVSCGTRFLNGRIYLQTPEGLRPAKITFPGEDREKFDNIARISLKIADKAIAPISSKKRRKSSKNDANHEDICQKQCATKQYSPLKDNEDNEKAIAKSKKNVKFTTLKTDQRKILKRIGTVDHVIAEKRMRISQCKNKREKKIEESDASIEQNELDVMKPEKPSDFTETEINSCTQLSMQDNSLSSTEVITKTQISSNVSNSTACSSSNKNVDATITTIPLENNIPSKSDLIKNKPWTRQEDMILLQSIKKEYSENAFLLISERLEDRTVNQVKERCQTLLSLLQKMM